MKIDELTIRNFRCFASDTRVSFEDSVTAFIGNNGSGKTAIFAALGKLFGISQSQRSVSKRDFFLPLNESELESGSQIVIDCVLSFPELDDPEADQDSVPDFFHHMAASDEDEALKVRVRLQASWIDDGTPEGVVEEDIRWVPSLGTEFSWDDCRRVQGAERSLVQLIYVPANRSAVDQVTALLKGRIWRAAKWSEDLATEASDSAESVQTQFNSELPTQFVVERLQQRWSDVHTGNTGAAPTLRLIESRLEELVRRSEFVFIQNEDGRPHRLHELSDGQRSLFHIALTAATLEVERDALRQDEDDCAFDQEKLKRTHLTILAIEEPENSLSPFFLARVMKQAREIGTMTGAQVIVSSHSPSILSRTEAEEVRYCRLDEDSRQSAVRSLTLPESESEAGKYIRLAVRSYPELYFARYVVLAEGDSEVIVLPRAAEALGISLDPSFVPIVPLAGRFVTHFWRLLTDLRIPYSTLLDLDLGRKHGGAKAIKYAVEQLAVIGNDLSRNRFVVDEEICLDEIDEISDAELLDKDQEHPWIKALRRESIYFSSPIDLDFAMLDAFPAAYQHVRDGGRGPRSSAQAISEKKQTTLKTGGTPDLYPANWDDKFKWYPYIFLNDSKPEAHIRALSQIDPVHLADGCPVEIKKLVQRIKRKLGL